MERAIVTFYTPSHERYRLAQERQHNALKEVFNMDHYYCFTSFEEIGSPAHSEVPYAFKPYSINKVKERGYRTILWMDSAVYPVKPLDKLFEEIENEGHYLTNNIGYSIGDYTSDECLRLCNMTRDQAHNSSMIMACLMGLDFTNPRTGVFFENYFKASKVQGCYEGDWTNESGQVSKDHRCRGHRHDQSVASILVHKLKMKISTGHQTYFTYKDNPGMMPVEDSVCLYSQGF